MEDKVFILSHDQVTAYLPTEAERKMFAFGSDMRTGIWWLRARYEMPGLSIVDMDGNFSAATGTVAASVRPAMWVDVSGMTEVPLNANSTESKSGVEILDLSGESYTGKLVIAHDPSKVIFGFLDSFGGSRASNPGLSLTAFMEKYGAVVGVNTSYMGNRGTSIQNGVVVYNSGTAEPFVIGFDAANVLHVGEMSAIGKGIVSGIGVGSRILVKDGKSNTNINALSRAVSCIGQREDGAILLMAVFCKDGNTLTKAGIDVRQVMLDNGAVTAATVVESVVTGGQAAPLMICGVEHLMDGPDNQRAVSILVLE